MSAFDAPRHEAGERWKLSAACRDADVDLWFPPRTGRPQDAKRIVAAAKAVCATCGVVDECLAYAIEHREQWGIWGGKTPTERRKSRLRRSGSWGRCRAPGCEEGVEAPGRLYCGPACRSKAQRDRARSELAAVRSERLPRAPLRVSEPTR